jgi:hypothetical protein
MASDSNWCRVRVTRRGCPASSDVADGVDAYIHVDRFQFGNETLTCFSISIARGEYCPASPLFGVDPSKLCVFRDVLLEPCSVDIYTTESAAEWIVVTSLGVDARDRLLRRAFRGSNVPPAALIRRHSTLEGWRVNPAVGVIRR